MDTESDDLEEHKPAAQTMSQSVGGKVGKEEERSNEDTDHPKSRRKKPLLRGDAVQVSDSDEDVSEKDFTFFRRDSETRRCILPRRNSQRDIFESKTKRRKSRSLSNPSLSLGSDKSVSLEEDAVETDEVVTKGKSLSKAQDKHSFGDMEASSGECTNSELKENVQRSSRFNTILNNILIQKHFTKHADILQKRTFSKRYGLRRAMSSIDVSLSDKDSVVLSNVTNTIQNVESTKGNEKSVEQSESNPSLAVTRRLEKQMRRQSLSCLDMSTIGDFLSSSLPSLSNRGKIHFPVPSFHDYRRNRSSYRVKDAETDRTSRFGEGVESSSALPDLEPIEEDVFYEDPDQRQSVYLLARTLNQLKMKTSNQVSPGACRPHTQQAEKNISPIHDAHPDISTEGQWRTSDGISSKEDNSISTDAENLSEGVYLEESNEKTAPPSESVQLLSLALCDSKVIREDGVPVSRGKMSLPASKSADSLSIAASGTFVLDERTCKEMVTSEDVCEIHNSCGIDDEFDDRSSHKNGLCHSKCSCVDRTEPDAPLLHTKDQNVVISSPAVPCNKESEMRDSLGQDSFESAHGTTVTEQGIGSYIQTCASSVQMTSDTGSAASNQQACDTSFTHIWNSNMDRSSSEDSKTSVIVSDDNSAKETLSNQDSNQNLSRLDGGIQQRDNNNDCASLLSGCSEGAESSAAETSLKKELALSCEDDSCFSTSCGSAEMVQSSFCGAVDVTPETGRSVWEEVGGGRPVIEFHLSSLEDLSSSLMATPPVPDVSSWLNPGMPGNSVQSVLRSTSDVSNLTSEGFKKKRERKIRPYKSDPCSNSAVERLGPPRQDVLPFHSTPERDTSLNTTESLISGTPSYQSLEELQEGESDSDAYFEENRSSCQSRLSNVSSASEDSGVVGSIYGSRHHMHDSYEADVSGQSQSTAASLVPGLGKSDVGRENIVCPVCNPQAITGDDVMQGEVEQVPCSRCCVLQSERREIIQEIVDTEKSFGRDLNILRDEFYNCIQDASLMNHEQLEQVFQNLFELISASEEFLQKLKAEVMVASNNQNQFGANVGKLFLESATMFQAFERYCINHGEASQFLEQLEREKEMLHKFLQASQKNNPQLRRMHLKSFLMMPVQRVMKYPLLLNRLSKVTPNSHPDKDDIRTAQTKIEKFLEHVNSRTKLGAFGSLRMKRKRSQCRRYSLTEKTEVNRVALEVLGWNKKEACDIITSRLMFATPTDHNWASKKCKNLKFTAVHAVLVALGQPKHERRERDHILAFPKATAVQEAAVVLIREKSGKYQVVRDPLMLDKCVVTVDSDFEEVFELHEWGREALVFKAEDVSDTKLWVQHLKQQTRDLGQWRRRRNALPNIMMKNI